MHRYIHVHSYEGLKCMCTLVFEASVSEVRIAVLAEGWLLRFSPVEMQKFQFPQVVRNVVMVISFAVGV